MRITADGTWLYQGSPIGRPALVKLFASVLRREADDTYWLVTPAERGRVEVDDAPFIVVEAASRGERPERQLRMRTNLEEWFEVGQDHPLRVGSSASGEPRVYLGLDRGLEAVLSRSVWYQLVDLALADLDEPSSDDHPIGIWSGGRYFELFVPALAEG